MVKFGENDPVKGYEKWYACTTWMRSAVYPQEVEWGFMTSYEKELSQLNKHLKGWASRFQEIIVCDTSSDEWGKGHKKAKIAKFKGVYESYPHFLIEVSFLRGYSTETADNTSWQHEIITKITQGTEKLRDFYKDDLNFILKGAGHSPFTDFQLQFTNLTVLQYIEGSKRVPKSTTYQCCATAYKTACDLYGTT
jgi:hypothetical protein